MADLNSRTPDLEPRFPLNKKETPFDEEQKKIDAGQVGSEQYETIDEQALADTDKQAQTSIIHESIKPTLEAIRQQPDNQTGALPLDLQPKVLEDIINSNSFDLDPFEVTGTLINKDTEPDSKV